VLAAISLPDLGLGLLAFQLVTVPRLRLRPLHDPIGGARNDPVVSLQNLWRWNRAAVAVVADQG
jgi:hypothetical protein